MAYNSRMAAITPTDAHQYLRRWSEVSQAQNMLDRQQTIETRLRQLSTLMWSRELFGSDPARETEVQRVRQHWLRIRAAFGD